MKYMIACTILLLVVTKSLYVEWTELFIIIGALSTVSVLIYSKAKRGVHSVLSRSAMIGLIFCWVFGLLDLILDHFMYYLPTGNEDGEPLSLGFKIQEYSDDLFVGSVVAMMAVMLISVLVLKPFRMKG